MALSKKLSINVQYQNKVKLFDCKHHELEEQISSHFRINLKDFEMFTLIKGERKQISLHEVKDFMKIEIVPPINGQQTTKGLNAFKKRIENISYKLRQNTPLNGEERKMLLEAVELNGMALFKKRKLEATDIHTTKKPESANKKVQVHMSNKDSFSQTDPLPNASKVDTHINNEDNDKEHQLTLKKLWLQHDVDMDLIDDLMDKTYERRRNFIHKGPSVSVIREEYPALFCVEQVKKELDRLFYPGKSEDFLRNMHVYTQHILHYRDGKTTDIIKIIDKAASRAKTTKQKIYAETVGSVFVLTKLLNEDFGFIHLSDHPHSSTDVFPYIDASLYSLQKIFFDGILYHVIVEGKHLCQASNFPEALLCLMAGYFIFNIEYPRSCQRTMTVIEKVCLKANDTLEMDETTEQWVKLLTMKENNYRKRKREMGSAIFQR